MRDRGNVQQQVGRSAKGRMHHHRVADRSVGQDVAACRCPAASCAASPAPSASRHRSQIGWPEGASAVCGSDMPSASATTCDVAAVPRNWQPPPGDAQARQPISAAYFQRDLLLRKSRADGLHLARVFAVLRQQRHAARHQHAGVRRDDASAIIMAGSPLSQVATPITPRRVGSDRIRRRSTIAASLR